MKRDYPMVATAARSPMPCSRCVAPQTYHNKLGTFYSHSHAVRDAAAARAAVARAAAARTRVLPIGAGQQASRNREETKHYPVYLLLCFCLTIFGTARRGVRPRVWGGAFWSCQPRGLGRAKRPKQDSRGPEEAFGRCERAQRAWEWWVRSWGDLVCLVFHRNRASACLFCAQRPLAGGPRQPRLRFFFRDDDDDADADGELHNQNRPCRTFGKRRQRPENQKENQAGHSPFVGGAHGEGSKRNFFSGETFFV